MDDLFNFGNTDNILGTPKNVATKQAGFSGHSTINDDSKTNKKDEKKDKRMKIVIVGDPQVGKTAFLTKHLNGSFDSKYRATMGASNFNLEFNTNLDSHKYEVLDVAGQNLFAGKRDQYYKDIKGAIIMYDVMNWASYDNVTDVWLRELKEKAPSGTPICIVGNKMENRDTRKVSVEVVAEAISNTFEPKGIHYCEISVKTNQNLAEPFLFLTKKILNIHDSKALYFVSKISELNLIESMLQHKKSKDDKAKESQDNNNNNNKSSPKSQNLDNLFLNDSSTTNTNNNNNNGNKAKGGDYLDDIIFKIGDGDNNQSAKSKTPQSKSPTDDNFLADMMGNVPMTKSKSHEPKVIPPPKTSTITTRSPPRIGKSQSISPKNQTSNIQSTSLSRSQSESRNRASSASVKVTTAVPTNNNNKNRKSNKPKQQRVTVNNNNNNTNDQSVMIDILLGLQETLNSLQSDVRRLQNDVSYLKQEFQKSKSQRR